MSKHDQVLQASKDAISAACATPITQFAGLTAYDVDGPIKVSSKTFVLGVMRDGNYERLTFTPEAMRQLRQVLNTWEEHVESLGTANSS